MLARLKPSPLPPVRPVPERAATGELAEIYERTKSGLGVPWMGVVAMAFARYPSFYKTFWQALEPVTATRAFTAACQDLRDFAETRAELFSPPPIKARLKDAGYDAAELEQIIACNEIFSAGNMPYLLMASLARTLLEGQTWTGRGESILRSAPPAAGEHPVLMEAHHASPDTAALYADLRETLGLPFVNTDYRAFARWPSYFAAAWGDLKHVIKSDGYEPAVQDIHERAVELALGLPNATGLTLDSLKAAAAQDADLNEILAVVQLFQWLLPGLAFNVAFLRVQLVTA